MAPGFWFSVAVSELPFLAAAWPVVSAPAAVVDGSLESASGYAVAGVAALTGGGPAVHARRGWNAEAEVRRALHDHGVVPPDPARDGAGRPS